jgi:hypothetical protein
MEFTPERWAEDTYRRSETEMQLVNALAALGQAHNELCMAIKSLMPSVYAPQIDIGAVLSNAYRVSFTAKGLLEGRGPRFTAAYNQIHSREARLKLLKSLPEYRSNVSPTGNDVRTWVCYLREYAEYRDHLWANDTIYNWLVAELKKRSELGTDPTIREEFFVKSSLLGPTRDEIVEYIDTTAPVRIYADEGRLFVLLVPPVKGRVVEVVFAPHAKNSWESVHVRTFLHVPEDDVWVAQSGAWAPVTDDDWVMEQLATLMGLIDFRAIRDEDFKDECLALSMPWQSLVMDIITILRTDPLSESGSRAYGGVNLKVQAADGSTFEIKVDRNWGQHFISTLGHQKHPLELPYFSMESEGVFLRTAHYRNRLIHPLNAGPALKLFETMGEWIITEATFNDVSDEQIFDIQVLLSRQSYMKYQPTEENVQ